MFVDIILPLPLRQLFTYYIPNSFVNRIQKGIRVLVPFGKKKIYAGIVYHIHYQKQDDYQPKEIISILDDEPVINEKQIIFWEWIAQYYMCSLGEVMFNGLPAGLKISSETQILLKDREQDIDFLTDKEYLIYEALHIKNQLSLSDISNILGQKNIYYVLNSLYNKNIIEYRENVLDNYKPKYITYIKLHEAYSNDAEIKSLFEILQKAPKQLEALMLYINESKFFSNTNKKVTKKLLSEKLGKSKTAIDALIKKEIFVAYEEEIDRINYNTDKPKIPLKELSEKQYEALQSIEKEFVEHNVSLLHGVTASGKTEVYSYLINKTIQNGKQVLYLLPEIALTSQIIDKLQAYFGSMVYVYHSRFNNNERVEIWNKVAEKTGKAKIILGARSAIFLPFTDLGLIIIDEEHEYSYKQYNTSPYYHARDAAIMLGHIHNAKVLLGSATPSFESYYNAKIKKYGYVVLKTRYQDILLPKIEVIDLKKEYKYKRMKSHFSPQLLSKIKAAIRDKKQVILFQNRRGFSSFLECSQCGWIPNCKHCDVTLTYHKKIDLLKCHYCGYSIKPPTQCLKCKSTKIQMQGFGTEKIEEELQLILPDARIKRMDLDTTTQKTAHKEIIYNFESGAIDILIGTQMITKGLDFSNVHLVGVLNADSLINFPDFRSYERSFQLMVQVAGRAGRKNIRGEVCIQSFNPNHSVIEQVLQHNYTQFAYHELIQRKKFHYPPYYRLIEISVKHRDLQQTNKAAQYLSDLLQKSLKSRVLGPEMPLIGRIKNQYIKKILIKIEPQLSLQKVKNFVLESKIDAQKYVKGINVLINVDPI